MSSEERLYWRTVLSGAGVSPAVTLDTLKIEPGRTATGAQRTFRQEHSVLQFSVRCREQMERGCGLCLNTALMYTPPTYTRAA